MKEITILTILKWYLIGIVVAYILLKIIALLDKEENTWENVLDRVSGAIGSWITVLGALMILSSYTPNIKLKGKPPKWL